MGQTSSCITNHWLLTVWHWSQFTDVNNLTQTETKLKYFNSYQITNPWHLSTNQCEKRPLTNVISRLSGEKLFVSQWLPSCHTQTGCECMCVCVFVLVRQCVQLDRKVDEGLGVSVKVWLSGWIMLQAFTLRHTHTHTNTHLFEMQPFFSR